jgi:DNA-binding response OmpR family regulator
MLKVDDLSFDEKKGIAFRAGRLIKLTPKERALLEYLMYHNGKLVTRTMISQHVWGIDFDTMTNVIDVTINYVRTKIDKGFKKKLIHTVRGRGYILKA